MRTVKQLLIFGCVVLLLAGCSKAANGGFSEPMTCFYLRKTPEYGAEDSVIASETREATGHTQDLKYLLSMYFQGPTDQSLMSPFPANTRLLSVSQNNGTLVITLSKEFTKLENAQLTLACACIMKTALGICDADSIQVIAESDEYPDVDFYMDEEHLLLFDAAVSGDADAETP